MERPERMEAANLVEQNLQVALGNRFIAASDVERRHRELEYLVIRDEEWSAIATPVRTVAALARIGFLAFAWQRFLTGALEKPVHFVSEGCMLGAASLSAAAAQKFEYFAVSLRGVLVTLKRAPGIQKQPVEPFD